MSQRHPDQNEATMFVTTVTKGRQPLFTQESYALEAIETLYRTQALHPFLLYGFVIMPDHCHLLLQVPPPETIARIMRVFKYGLSMNIGIGPIWQPRFHMRLAENVQGALKYIYQNPVKAGLAESPEQYQWSSACGKWDVTELDVCPM